jgi:hypothetical protein
VNIVHHINYKGNHQRKILLVFSKELLNCWLPNCTVNYYYLQIKSLTDWKVIGVICQFSKKVWLNYNFKLNITDGITDRLKSRQWYLAISEKNLLNWKFKLNIINVITDGMIKNINIKLSIGKIIGKTPQ